MNIHDYVNNYEFRGDGADHTPTEDERAMLEDVIAGYLASLPQEPAAWANGDELDNMLNDRTAIVAGVPDGDRYTTLDRPA